MYEFNDPMYKGEWFWTTENKCYYNLTIHNLSLRVIKSQVWSQVHNSKIKNKNILLLHLMCNTKLMHYFIIINLINWTGWLSLKYFKAKTSVIVRDDSKIVNVFSAAIFSMNENNIAHSYNRKYRWSHQRFDYQQMVKRILIEISWAEGDTI